MRKLTSKSKDKRQVSASKLSSFYYKYQLKKLNETAEPIK